MHVPELKILFKQLQTLCSNVFIFIPNCHKLNPRRAFLCMAGARAAPLPSQGLNASPDPAQPTASATAALCTSCATSAKILKQSNSYPFPPAQNRRYSGLSLDWQNIKSNCLNCTQPAAKSMTYSSDTSSAVRITRKGKKKKNLQLLPKIIQLCTSTETSGTVISKENSRQLVLL